MTATIRLKWFYAILFLFLAAGLVMMANEFYWIALLPFILGIVLLAMYAMDVLLMIIVFCTPLAINLEGQDLGVALSMPTEPLMAGITLLFLIKITFERGFDNRIIRHPVSVAIIIYLVWMFITSLTSTMPMVSLKHLAAQLWFICPFYFLGTQMFKSPPAPRRGDQEELQFSGSEISIRSLKGSGTSSSPLRGVGGHGLRNIRVFIWLYIIPLLIVIVYTIVNHQMHGFNQKSAHLAMAPFYNDHTAYAAVIAMFIPITIAFMIDNSYSMAIRTISFFIFVVMITAIVLSYTRAAWVSMGVAFVVFLIFYFRIRFVYVFAAMIIMAVLYFNFQTQIILKLEHNKAQSATDFDKHLQSISNIRSDASNLERLNRWHSAFRMFGERPFFGWGPGTYQFKYAPFQQAKDRTIISTNAGNGGNAHSEYIGPLAEEGVLGFLTFALIVVTVTWRAIVLYSRSHDKEIRMLTLAVFLGLVTYLVHGSLNDFLDTDKAAVPFWGFIAIIVTMDVYFNGHKSSNYES